MIGFTTVTKFQVTCKGAIGTFTGACQSKVG